MNKYFHRIAIDAASTVDLFNNYEPPHLQIEKFAKELFAKMLPDNCTDEIEMAMLVGMLEASPSEIENMSSCTFDCCQDDVIKVYKSIINYYKKD